MYMLKVNPGYLFRFDARIDMFDIAKSVYPG